jgi:hypothetical protein
LGAPEIENASRSPGFAAPLGAAEGTGAGDAEGVLPPPLASIAIAMSSTTSPSTTPAWMRQRFSTRADRAAREGCG